MLSVQWPHLFFFFFGEAASVVNPSSSVVYSGLVTSVGSFRGSGTPAAVTEEVARGTKGVAEVDRLLALFLKSVINFVRSNDIQCEICVDQSYEILSLLYYRDCFNL